MIADTIAELNTALGGIPGVRNYPDVGAAVDPPAVTLGPPTLTWGAYVSAPTSATFTVTLAVAADERALERALELVPAVADAIESVTDAVVLTASPGSVSLGNGSELPAYLLEIEVSL